jgi:hypothetical protein
MHFKIFICDLKWFDIGPSVLFQAFGQSLPLNSSSSSTVRGVSHAANILTGGQAKTSLGLD